MHRVGRAVIAVDGDTVLTGDARKQQAASDEAVALAVHQVVADQQVHDACDRVQRHVLGENLRRVLGANQPCLEHGEPRSHPHDQGTGKHEPERVQCVLKFLCRFHVLLLVSSESSSVRGRGRAPRHASVDAKARYVPGRDGDCYQGLTCRSGSSGRAAAPDWGTLHGYWSRAGAASAARMRSRWKTYRPLAAISAAPSSVIASGRSPKSTKP